MSALSLRSRLDALEHRLQPPGIPSVYVRALSDEHDPEELQRACEEEARAAYIAEHGEPPGGVGVVHNIIVHPKRHAGGVHA